MKYEYDKDMDETYQKSLVKSFKKTIDDALFNFIIVDMINERLNKMEDMSSYAKQRGFHVYIGEMIDYESSPDILLGRNVHGRSIEEIKKVLISYSIFILQKLPI
jgi:hypothetical protein